MEDKDRRGQCRRKDRMRERKAFGDMKTDTSISKSVVKLKSLDVGDSGSLHENTKVCIKYILET